MIMSDLKQLNRRKKWLREAVRYHGHVCMGQVLGVLIAEKGMELIGTSDPHEMIVIAENDRCIADALQIITGTRLGRRSFKLRDYGKMAATFYNTQTRKAYRVWVSSNITGGRDYFALPEKERKKMLMNVLKSDIGKTLRSMPVVVSFSENELPGKPKIRVECDKCGERVMDGKHVVKNGKKLCISCTNGAYYKMGRK